MSDANKTKSELIAELAELRRRIADMEEAGSARELSIGALARQEAALRATLYRIGDAIIYTDLDGCVLQMNPVAEQLTGWSEIEATGKLVDEIFQIFNEQTRRPVESPVARVLGEGAVVGLANHTLLVARDGKERLIADAGAPTLDSKGNIAGVVLVFRDQTEERLTRRFIEARLALIEFAASHTLDELLTRTLDEVGAFVNSPIGFYHFVEPDQKTLSLQQWSTRTLEEFCEAEGQGLHYDVGQAGVWVDCVYERKPVIHNDYKSLAHKKGLPEGHAEVIRELVVPVMREGKVVAILGVGNKPTNYSESDVEIVSYLADVTWEIVRQKRAEEAIRTSENKFRSITENAVDFIFLKDRDGRYTFVNKAMQELLGLPEREILGRTPEELFGPEQGRIVKEIDDRAYSGATVNETRSLNINGRQLVFDTVQTPLTVEDGAVTSIMGIVRDVTARKQAEEERERLSRQIRQQAQQMEQVLVTVPAGVLLLDAEGRVLQANPVAEDALIILAEAGEGDVLTHLGDRALPELLASPSTSGLWHEVKAGQHTFEIIARPTDADREARYWVLVIIDVTKEREIQTQLRQQEQLAALGQLAAGVAHDFNNILASIVLYAQIAVRSGELSERNRERMAVIDRQVWHASRLVEQILDFSRRGMLERQPLDLLPLLREQTDLLRRTLPENIDVELDYGTERYRVHADPTRMQQILTNLAVNARDAMPRGGTLRIGLDRIMIRSDRPLPIPEMEAGTWIQWSVSDTGNGIPHDILPHVFEPFFTTKGPGNGSGLGLAQAHGIVGQHGGHIGVETEKGKGTTFTIYLPALNKREAAPLPPEVSAIPTGSGELLLVVEDGDAVRAALAATLEQLNYRVLEAANGEQALEILERMEERIALVLSDVVMPLVDGISLFRSMQQSNWNVPIILLTGHPMGEELDALQAEGLAGWLTKPPRIEQLAKMICDTLRE